MSLLTTELELALRAPRGNAELIATVRAALDDTNRLSRLAQDLLLLARSAGDDTSQGGRRCTQTAGGDAGYRKTGPPTAQR